MEISMINSEIMEVTSIPMDSSLLEEMLSEEN